jgi:hypothetical protein
LSGEWLTYREAAGRLGSNVEAVRQRAIRCRWPRTVGNDKRARIQIPEGLPIPVQEGNEGGFRDGNERASRKGNERAYDRPFIKALEAHVETLKAQLAAAEARIDKQADDLVAYDTAYAEGLASERTKVEAERAKAERVIAEFAARDAQHVADLAAERARTEKAIAAFASLADRLDALAAARAKPWWRRLTG